MSKPYSVDLRSRVVSAVEEGRMSRRKAASHFGVSARVAIEWVRRFRETGSVAPSKIGGYKPRKISGPYRDWLIARCGKQDFTLRGLVEELAGHGLRVDYRSVWEFVHAEGLSYKKNRRRQRAGSPRRRAKASAVAEISGPD